MQEFFLDGGAAGGGSGAQGSPFNSVNSVPNTGGELSDSTTLNFRGGSSTPMDIGPGLRPPNGGTLIVRAYDGGALPVVASVRKGFLGAGVGSLLNAQDVHLQQTLADATGIQANDGGSLTLRRVKMTGWFNQVKCGTGVLLLEDNDLSDFAWNGVMCDAIATAAIAVNAIFRRNRIEARLSGAPGQDPFVLHDGGIGLGTGYLVEQNIIIAGNPQSESGMMDEQQQYRGVTVRQNQGLNGASQWGYAQGSLIKNTNAYVWARKSDLLAYYNREGVIGAPLLPNNANFISCGHIAIVTNDGANNGWYQLTGNDPSLSGSWAGPMTAADFLAVKTLVYENLIEGHGGGIQIQHPGTEMAANLVRRITGSYGSALKLYPMGYGIKMWDQDLQLAGGGSNGRAVIRIDALESHIAATERLKMRNTKVMTDAQHSGAFFDLGSAADAGHIDSDYCAFIRPTLTNLFATVAGQSKTFAEFKALNGASDAHSQHITLAAALIDSDGRLLDGSPLIGAGVARSGLDAGIPAVDAEGNALSSPPDIGALRYLSGVVAEAVVPTGRRLLRSARTAAGSAPGGTPPGAIVGLALAGATATTLALTWTADEQAGYYEAETFIGGDWVPYGDGFTGVISGLDAGTAYDIRVRPLNGAGPGPWASIQASTAAAIWLRPQVLGAGAAGFPGMPALAEKYMATGDQSNPGAYADPNGYTLLTDNGGAGGGVALVAVDDDTLRRLNAVLTMIGMSSGRHWRIAQRASHTDDGAQSVYFAYGAHSSLASMYALQVDAAGDLVFMRRGLGAGSSTSTTLAHDSGPDYSAYNGQGRYTIILSLRAVSAIAVDVEVRIVHATVGTSVWSASALDCSFGGDAATLPGIVAGQTAAAHGGLMLGGRMRSAAANFAPERSLGNGAGNVARLADFEACVDAAYAAARVDAAVAAVLAGEEWVLG